MWAGGVLSLGWQVKFSGANSKVKGHGRRRRGWCGGGGVLS